MLISKLYKLYINFSFKFSSIFSQIPQTFLIISKNFSLKCSEIWFKFL